MLRPVFLLTAILCALTIVPASAALKPDEPRAIVALISRGLDNAETNFESFRGGKIDDYKYAYTGPMSPTWRNCNVWDFSTKDQSDWTLSCNAVYHNELSKSALVAQLKAAALPAIPSGFTYELTKNSSGDTVLAWKGPEGVTIRIWVQKHDTAGQYYEVGIERSR